MSEKEQMSDELVIDTGEPVVPSGSTEALPAQAEEPVGLVSTAIPLQTPDLFIEDPALWARVVQQAKTEGKEPAHLLQEIVIDHIAKTNAPKKLRFR